MGKKIVVVGSSNTDMVIKTENFPRPGETLLGGVFLMNPGGKGANQAVSAARLGGDVTFIAKLGTDIFGDDAFQQFKNENIDTQFIIRDSENPSGVALITVDSKGENTIVVAAGANGSVSEQDVLLATKEIENSEIILVQLEIPLSIVELVVELGRKHNKRVILNPAPAMPLNEAVFDNLYLITPNKTEAETLTGTKIDSKADIEYAARLLKMKGVQNIIITLGSEGVYILNDELACYINAVAVKAVDTTAAGDVFNGALAVALANNEPLYEAVEFACMAAAQSVTKMGAQASAPYLKDFS
ncbi:MAG TPA: ribokinase [Sphingobacteriaceae bacterium]|nr:ribokinase [Sphingobacteriaceae bacterium]